MVPLGPRRVFLFVVLQALVTEPCEGPPAGKGMGCRGRERWMQRRLVVGRSAMAVAGYGVAVWRSKWAKEWNRRRARWWGRPGSSGSGRRLTEVATLPRLDHAALLLRPPGPSTPCPGDLRGSRWPGGPACARRPAGRGSLHARCTSHAGGPSPPPTASPAAWHLGGVRWRGPRGGRQAAVSPKHELVEEGRIGLPKRGATLYLPLQGSGCRDGPLTLADPTPEAPPASSRRDTR